MAKAPHLAARLPGSLCHTALQFQIYCTYTGLSSSDSSPEPSETVGPAAAEMELQKDQLVARPARGLPKSRKLISKDLTTWRSNWRPGLPRCSGTSGWMRNGATSGWMSSALFCHETLLLYVLYCILGEVTL